MKIPLFRCRVCADVKFDALTLPCVWFLLGLTTCIAAMIVGSTEWIFVTTLSNSTYVVPSNQTYEYRTGLFKQCVGSSCDQINFDWIGPMGHHGCYSNLQGPYAATSAFLFVGIGFGVISVWMTWKVWRGVLRDKPKRRRIYRRRSWFCILCTCVAYAISFFIFIGTSSTSGSCGVKYCDGGYCSTGAPPWFCLGISLLCLWAWFIMYSYDPLVPKPQDQVTAAINANVSLEQVERNNVMSEEDGEFAGICHAALNEISRIRGYVMSVTRGMVPPPLPPGVGAAAYTLPPAQLLPQQQYQQQQQYQYQQTQMQVQQQVQQPMYYSDPQKPLTQQEPLETKQPQDLAQPAPPAPPAAAPAAAAASQQSGTFRPSIGVEIQMMDDERGNRENLVMVHSVVAGGPSDLAGVQPGDILAKWDARPLSSKQAFAECLKHAKIDSDVVLTIVRNNTTVEKMVRVKGTVRRSAQAK